MTIIQGNCLEVLKSYPDNHFTSIITDPPYGLSFMGKKWDYDVPSIDIWKECLRVLKPGGTMLCFAGSRTQHRMAVNIEDAGFLIKDCLMWIYGQGFPKSYNVGKKTNEDFEGYGTALKPAYEPIIMAMKPNDGSYAENALKWGVSGINIDAGRIIPSLEDAKSMERANSPGSGRFKSGKFGICGKDGFGNKSEPYNTTQGRFPANILLDEESAAFLDQESGILKSGNVKPYISKSDGFLQGCSGKRTNSFKGDFGGASRFFYCAKASKRERNEGCEELEEKYVAWSNQAKAELARGNTEFRNKDDTTAKHNKVQGLKNSHPTVKPLSLMEYLIKLIMSPKDGLILDPFAGSGTTILAAKRLGYNAVGIEREPEYCEIARHRLASVKSEDHPQQMDLFDGSIQS
jgi:site-specific DNA-methyltransferase (adenine-specific)